MWEICLLFKLQASVNHKPDSAWLAKLKFDGMVNGEVTQLPQPHSASHSTTQNISFELR